MTWAKLDQFVQILVTCLPKRYWWGQNKQNKGQNEKIFGYEKIKITQKSEEFQTQIEQQYLNLVRNEREMFGYEKPILHKIRKKIEQIGSE